MSDIVAYVLYAAAISSFANAAATVSLGRKLQQLDDEVFEHGQEFERDNKRRRLTMERVSGHTDEVASAADHRPSPPVPVRARASPSSLQQGSQLQRHAPSDRYDSRFNNSSHPNAVRGQNEAKSSPALISTRDLFRSENVDWRNQSNPIVSLHHRLQMAVRAHNEENNYDPAATAILVSPFTRDNEAAVPSALAVQLLLREAQPAVQVNRPPHVPVQDNRDNANVQDDDHYDQGQLRRRATDVPAEITIRMDDAPSRAAPRRRCAASVAENSEAPSSGYDEIRFNRHADLEHDDEEGSVALWRALSILENAGLVVTNPMIDQHHAANNRAPATTFTVPPVAHDHVAAPSRRHDQRAAQPVQDYQHHVPIQANDRPHVPVQDYNRPRLPNQDYRADVPILGYRADANVQDYDQYDQGYRRRRATDVPAEITTMDDAPRRRRAAHAAENSQ